MALEKRMLDTTISKNRYTVFQTSAMLMHLAMILIFLWIGVRPMALINIGSVIVYVICGVLISKEKYFEMNLLFYMEVLVHSITATVLTGWNTGFAIYLFASVPIAFFFMFSHNTRKGTKIALVVSIVSVAVFIACKLETYFFEPVYSVETLKTTIVYLLNSFFSFFLLIICSFAFLNEMKNSHNKLTEKFDSLNKMASVDSLTGLYNRRSMNKLVWDAIDKGKPFSLIMCDIDDFKKVNDTYGHDCGDLVLKSVASVIKSTLRDFDVVCRWGGEEILVLVSNSNASSAAQVGERIRARVEGMNIKYGSHIVKCTLTLGVAEHDFGRSYEETITIADERLYEGKKSGKNKVVSEKIQMPSL